MKMSEFSNKDLTVSIKNTKVTMEKSVRKYFQELLSNIAEELTWDLDDCESPIEQLMCLALNHHAKHNFYARNLSEEYEIFMVQGQTKIGYKEDENECNAVKVTDELAEKKYRVDFAVELADQKKQESWTFAIECDSQQHHLTEDRFLLDRVKDRDLMTAGIIVLRYTGKEIVKDPSACARDVFKTIYHFVNR
jgi:very-short-patch-repair endonuclease